MFHAWPETTIQPKHCSLSPLCRLLPRKPVAGLRCLLSALGRYPDVKITGASNPYAEGLFADKHCGAGTEFIFYIEPGSIVSRSFTSKDTHSPRGDLLVAYSDARSSHRHTKLTRDTAALLGFKAPSFTFETDLFLPFRANADLRKALSNYPDNNLADADEDEAALQAVKTLELMDYFTIPQVRLLSA